MIEVVYALWRRDMPAFCLEPVEHVVTRTCEDIRSGNALAFHEVDFQLVGMCEWMTVRAEGPASRTMGLHHQ